MNEVLSSKLQNPSQKFCKNLINLKNPKHFPKTTTFRTKDMKMHEKEGLGHLPSEENLIEVEESLRKRLGVKERGFRGEESREIERDRAK